MNKYPTSSLSGVLKLGALSIAGGYLILGSLWILFSDKIAARIALNEEMLTSISLYKGWAYVLVTALLIYWLIQRYADALHASELQLQHVIDAMPVFISYVGTDRRYRFTNKAYRERYEVDTEGKHIEEVLGKPAYQAISKYVDQALAGETVSYETELPYQGTELFMDVNYIPDSAADGHVKGFFVMAQDKTAQRRAEEELKLWADAFEGCAHGIAIDDPNTNRIVVCNPAFAKMYGSRVEDIIGSAILSLYAPSDYEHVRRNVQKADQIGHARFETSMTRKGRDRSTFPVQIDVVSVLGDDGEILHRVVTVQDISERKVMDEKLRQSETKYRTLVEHLPAITYTSEPDQYVGVSYISPQIEVLGFDAETWLADPQLWLRLIHPDDQEQVVKELQRFQDGTESFRAEYRFMLPNGETRWFHDESIRIKDQDGKILLKQGFMLDITESKLVEDKLRKSEERYHYLFVNNPHPMWIYDRKTLAFLDVNEAAIVKYGYSRQEFLNMTIVDIRPLEDVEKLTNNLAQPRQPLERSEGWRHRLKDGSIIHVEITSHTVEIDGHESALVIAQDITQRKQAEKVLQESEERYRMVSELTSDYAYKDRIEEDGRIIPEWFTESFTRITGYTLEETRAPGFWEKLVHPEDIRILMGHIQNVLSGQPHTMEIRVITKSGELKWLRDYSNPIWDANPKRVAGLYGAVQDVTEHKQVQEKLLLQARWLEQINDAVIASDRNLVITAWNPAAEHIYGWKADEVIGKRGEDVLKTEFFSRTRADALQQLQATGEFSAEITHLRKDGSRVFIETHSVALKDGSGQITGYVSANRDISERKQIEQALQAAHDELEQKVQERTAALTEANALLQALMDNTPDHIYFKDTQSRFIRNSRSQASLLGLHDPSETVGKTDFDFFPHAARSYAEEQEIMNTGKPLVDFEEWVIWPDGREMWVSTTKMPLRNSEGQTIGIFGISRDITERKRNEQAIRQLNADLEKQAEQLQAAIKELEAFSYSVSHDLRAPLRAIDGYTRILVEDYEATLGDEGKRICSVISREARRMGQLIDDLLAFSRLGRKEMYSSRIDMETLATSVFEELIKDENRERIDLELGALPVARGDSSLIRQVWVNLLSNAIKFTSKKERTVIQVGSQQNDDENIYYVRDNGAGFDMEYGNKLFGVFQRLHSESEFSGTGVGLAIVQRIIRRHDGRVWAEGEVEKGATFYFALPRKENPL